jgi:hypothetical protein
LQSQSQLHRQLKRKDRTAGSPERILIGRATELQSLIFTATARAKRGVIAICGQSMTPTGSAKQREPERIKASDSSGWKQSFRCLRIGVVAMGVYEHRKATLQRHSQGLTITDKVAMN